MSADSGGRCSVAHPAQFCYLQPCIQTRAGTLTNLPDRGKVVSTT